MAYTIAELEEIDCLMQGMVSTLNKRNFDPNHWTMIHIANQTPTEEIRAWAGEQIKRHRLDGFNAAQDNLRDFLSEVERQQSPMDVTAPRDAVVITRLFDRLKVYEPFDDCVLDPDMVARKDRLLARCVEYRGHTIQVQRQEDRAKRAASNAPFRKVLGVLSGKSRA